MNYLVQVAVAAAAAVVLAACGGGDALLPSAQAAVLPSAGQMAPAVVTIEGCAGTATMVQALGTDGRLLASAPVAADGLFRLAVPAGRDVRLVGDDDQPTAFTVRVGREPVFIGGCLRAAA